MRRSTKYRISLGAQILLHYREQYEGLPYRVMPVESADRLCCELGYLRRQTRIEAIAAAKVVHFYGWEVLEKACPVRLAVN